MKYVFGILTVAFLLSSCNNSSKSEVQAEETHSHEGHEHEQEVSKPTFTLAMLDDKHDYVCGMDLDRDDFISDTTLYEGKVYGFCAAECKESFLKDPQHYLSSKK